MKKKLLSLVCVLLLVVGAVFGTYAYLTAQDSVTNTFTVGKVGLYLDETYVDEYGRPLTEDGEVAVEGDTIHRVQDGNDYKLMPGHTYVKDPTVTVLGDSEESYVRMKVKVEGMDDLMAAIPVNTEEGAKYYADGVFLLEKLCTGWDKTIWKYEAFDSETDTYEFRYYKTVSTVDDDAMPLEALFTNIKLPEFVTNTDIENHLVKVQIHVTAEAIQADGFETAAEAGEKF